MLPPVYRLQQIVSYDNLVPTALAEAWLVSNAFKAIGRNPKLEETLFPKVIISVALVLRRAVLPLLLVSADASTGRSSA